MVGSFCERDGKPLYNSPVAVGPDGLILHLCVHRLAARLLCGCLHVAGSAIVLCS